MILCAIVGEKKKEKSELSRQLKVSTLDIQEKTKSLFSFLIPTQFI